MFKDTAEEPPKISSFVSSWPVNDVYFDLSRALHSRFVLDCIQASCYITQWYIVLPFNTLGSELHALAFPSRAVSQWQ